MQPLVSILVHQHLRSSKTLTLKSSRRPSMLTLDLTTCAQRRSKCLQIMYIACHNEWAERSRPSRDIVAQVNSITNQDISKIAGAMDLLPGVYEHSKKDWDIVAGFTLGTNPAFPTNYLRSIDRYLAYYFCARAGQNNPLPSPKPASRSATVEMETILL